MKIRFYFIQINKFKYIRLMMEKTLGDWSPENEDLIVDPFVVDGGSLIYKF
jgi:hypothetical protein